MENLDVGSIINIVLLVVTTVFGGMWLKAKGKLGQIKKVAKEGYEAIQTVVTALDDDKIDATEQVNIKKEALEAWVAIKTLLGINK